MEIIRAIEEWQRAGAHFVRVEGMMREHDLTLQMEFSDDTPQSRYILALDGHFPVGTCRLHRLSETTMQIERVVVIPEYRGKGVGRQVIAAAEEWAKEQGAKEVLIHSRLCAAGFYEKSGYTTDYSEVEGEGDFQCVYTRKQLTCGR